jgi:hypothetical protein
VLVGREVFLFKDIAAQVEASIPFSTQVHLQLDITSSFPHYQPNYYHHAFLSSHNQQYLLIFTTLDQALSSTNLHTRSGLVISVMGLFMNKQAKDLKGYSTGFGTLIRADIMTDPNT